MVASGSESRRLAVPALLTPALVLVGVASMTVASALAQIPRLGLRPTLALAEIALVAPSLLALLAFRVPLAEGLRLKAPARRVTLLAALSGVTFWVASLGLFELQYAVWRPPQGYLESFRQLHAALRPAGPLDAIVSILAIAVAPAVCEELLFRGVAFPSLLRPFGPLGACLASALLFGAIHLDVLPGPTGDRVVSAYRIPFAVVIGVGLAALRLVSGSLASSMLSHATLNTLTFVVEAYFDDPAAVPESHPLLGAALLVAGGVASLVVLRLVARASAGTGDLANRSG